MARTIGYSRFRDSKPSYLLRAYSGATYSNFSLCTGRSRFVTHDAVRSIVIEETTAQDLVCSKSAAATIVRTAIPSEGVFPYCQLTRSMVRSEVKPRWSKPSAYPIRETPRWCYPWIPRLHSLLRPGL